MAKSDALITTLSNAIQAVGRGFDVTSDIRLLYCKGAPGSRLIHIDEDHKRDILISDDVVLPNVSVDIEYSPGKKAWEATPVCNFHEMSEHFNKKSGLTGSIPLGSFNAMFNFSGNWQADAAATKSLATLGYFIPLYKLQLKSQLALKDEIKAAVPYTWDPPALARQDVTVIFRRRGGDDLEQSSIKWAETVYLSPDVIDMTFEPIVSLLEGVPGLKHLAHAIELYLEYKPPLEDLQYFLEFQIPRVWAPEQSNLQRKEPVCQSLHFSLMGPKLYISPEQVTVGRKPVTGLRLSLEGAKQNRLAIHLQHLVSLPKILQPHWDSHMAIGAQKWQGPEEQDSRWFEPIKWKHFSHVSTAPIEYKETCIVDLSGVHIVTGAQLGVWDFGVKSVLYLKLLFSKVPGCTIRRSVWDHTPSNFTALHKADGTLSNEQTPEDKRLDSGGAAAKLAKLVDSTEMLKGPQDLPGHWLVTGAKLGVDKGKIVLRAKYSLLNY
uniref:MACPF domain-containing protein n=1 Tax=Chenopodium quinoa TaxID=63459 RepID=A0A803N2V0_CHEQI